MPQVVLHVGRDRDKRRRLSEIAVLRAGEDGRVRVATTWCDRLGRYLGLRAASALLHR